MPVGSPSSTRSPTTSSDRRVSRKTGVARRNGSYLLAVSSSNPRFACSGCPQAARAAPGRPQRRRRRPSGLAGLAGGRGLGRMDARGQDPAGRPGWGDRLPPARPPRTCVQSSRPGGSAQESWSGFGAAPSSMGSSGAMPIADGRYRLLVMAVMHSRGRRSRPATHHSALALHGLPLWHVDRGARRAVIGRAGDDHRCWTARHAAAWPGRRRVERRRARRAGRSRTRVVTTASVNVEAGVVAGRRGAPRPVAAPRPIWWTQPAACVGACAGRRGFGAP